MKSWNLKHLKRCASRLRSEQIRATELGLAETVKAYCEGADYMDQQIAKMAKAMGKEI